MFLRQKTPQKSRHFFYLRKIHQIPKRKQWMNLESFRNKENQRQGKRRLWWLIFYDNITRPQDDSTISGCGGSVEVFHRRSLQVTLPNIAGHYPIHSRPNRMNRWRHIHCQHNTRICLRELIFFHWHSRSQVFRLSLLPPTTPHDRIKSHFSWHCQQPMIELSWHEFLRGI